MPALTNIIVRKFIDTVPKGKKYDIKKFEEYLYKIVDDNDKVDDDIKEIHKTSFYLWRVVMLAKDYVIPRDYTKNIIRHVNYSCNQYDMISITENQLNSLNIEFEQWIRDWRYGKKITDAKVKVLFINLFQTIKDENVLRIQPLAHTFNCDNLHLDHMEASNLNDSIRQKYFSPNDLNEKREDYVNSLGNFILLDQKDNTEKNNRPLQDSIKFYENMCMDHWIINEVKEMLVDDHYSKEVMIENEQYRVPIERFFTERRTRLQKYFKALLMRDIAADIFQIQ